VTQKTGKKRKTPLPRPKTPCKAYYLLSGVPDPDPREAKLLKVDWDGPTGVSAVVEFNTQTYHSDFSSVIPMNEETAQLVIELRDNMIQRSDLEDRAKNLIKKLRSRSLMAIRESEG
jgi:hypothetical protein